MKKKLTIVIPIYNPIIPIEKIMNNIYKQINKNFNAILIIDNPKNEQLYELDKLQKQQICDFKIIFNTSHQNMGLKLKQVLSLIETSYVYILDQNFKIKNEFFERINKLLDSSKISPDLIEIPFSIKEYSYSYYKDKHLPLLKLVDLDKNNLPLALASINISNYIIKKEVIANVIENSKLKDLNFENSIKFIYDIFLNSKTYIYFKHTWIRDLNGKFVLFNIQSLSRIWGIIFSSVNKEQINKLEALEFARFMSYCFYAAGSLGVFKIKPNTLKYRVYNNMKNTLIKEIESNKDSWLLQITKNPYFENLKINELNKLTEGFTKKWHLIFKKFTW